MCAQVVSATENAVLTNVKSYTSRVRVKSNWQMANEAEALIAIAGERAKQRQQFHGGTAPGKTLVEPVPQVNGGGKARDEVGARVVSA